MISRLLVALLSTVSLTLSYAIDPIPLAQDGSDITPDSAVTWGLLDNGLRYVILPNTEPRNRVSMRLYVDAGSLMENDDQQGLAHFLEHMAFNGTKHFPAGEMVEYFQRLGMGFGNHTNAHTSFRETVYKLELPKTDSAMIDEGMKLFRDFADGMLLDNTEINDERGIILSEKRDRDSVDWRTFVDEISFAFPDQRISKRLPIGTEAVIQNAPRERFVEFYHDWYTADRMAVVVVGDIKVDAIEPIINKYFADMPGQAKKTAPAMGDLSKRGFAAHLHYEAEAGETSISIEAAKPRVNPPDNTERRFHDLQLNLASNIISRRLERLVKAADSPISSASMRTSGDFFDLGFAEYSSINADCKPENWKAALSLIEQELRRALEHGFTDAEMTEAKGNVKVRYEDAAKKMATRQSRQLADDIAKRIGARRIFTSPSDDFPRVVASLDKITTESCRDSLKELWNDAHETLVYVSGNAKIDDAVAQITSVWEESQKVAVTAPNNSAVAEFSYAQLPTAGSVAEKKEIEDLSVTQIRFANQVRANLKPTDFEKSTIYIKARIGAGLMTEPKPGLSLLLSQTFIAGGLEAHSDDDLKALFAGKSVEVNFNVDEDAFILSGRTTPEALADELSLMRAYILHPGFREEALTEFKGSLDYQYQQVERTPEGVLQGAVAQFLHDGDSRFGYPPRTTVEALTSADARKWVTPDLNSGYCEVTLVGDFDRDTAVKLLSETFGNLPERAAEKPKYEEERQVKFPAAGSREFTFSSEIPKAMVLLQWPTTDLFEIQKTRRLGMLSAVLDDRLRLKIREELGDAYSPFAHNIPSSTWKDYGYLFAAVTVDPTQIGKVTEVLSGIASDLAKGDSITEDELDRAKRPQIVTIEEMRRTNRYWMSSVLEASQEYPQRLDWSRSFVDDYKDISVADLNALAKEFLRKDTQVTVSIKPVTDSGDAAKPSK